MRTSDTVTVPWTQVGSGSLLTTPDTWSSNRSLRWKPPVSPTWAAPVPAFCLGPGDDPWVAFVETEKPVALANTSFGPYVWKYSGGAWSKVSGPASDGALSTHEVTMWNVAGYTGGGDMDIDGQGSSFGYQVAELELAYDGLKVYCTSREQVGGPLAAGGGPPAQLANALRTVWMHDGSSWTRTTLPNSGSSVHWAQEWCATLRANADDPGHPVIAWYETERSNSPGDYSTIVHSYLYCARWSGSAWVAYGGAPIVTDWASSWTALGDMVLDKNGYPHVIMSTNPNAVTYATPPIRIFSWTGSAWIETQLDVTDLGLDSDDYRTGALRHIQIPPGSRVLGVSGSAFSEKHGASDNLHQVLLRVRRFSNANDPSDPAPVGVFDFVFEWDVDTRSVVDFHATQYLGEALGSDPGAILTPQDTRNLSWYLNSTGSSFSLIAYDARCQGWWLPTNVFDVPSFGILGPHSFAVTSPGRMLRDGSDFYVVMPWYSTTATGIDIYQTTICAGCGSCGAPSSGYYVAKTVSA